MDKSYSSFLQFLLDDICYFNAECILSFDNDIDGIYKQIENAFADKPFGAKSFDEAVPNKQNREVVLQYLRIAYLMDLYNSDIPGFKEHKICPAWFAYWEKVKEKKDVDTNNYIKSKSKDKKPK